MVLDLKMCRFENVPWGFRLIGGSDFDIPLTVVKVTEGSIAELAGMRVNDIIVRINDEATSQLSHNDAHDVISKCGNNFFFGVVREDDESINTSNNENLQIQQQDQIEMSITPDSMRQSKSPVSEIYERRSEPISDSNQNMESLCNESENLQEKLSEEEIAELISGEAEVLKDHNVIGVNFNRIFPKPGVCMSSQVLRQLNDEAIKTKIEREKEKRKWTTFMQKPDRPIPKSRKEIEEEKAKKASTYKVVIQKQPKPRVAPDRTPTPPPVPVPEPEPIVEPEISEPEEESKPLADSEVPDLEPVDSSENDHTIENNEINNDAAGQEIGTDENQGESIEEELKPEEENSETEIVEKTEEELILERQLADVQKQLLALSSLPSTIQATLDAVTKQLAELLPTFKLQPAPVVEVEQEEKPATENAECEEERTEFEIEVENNQEIDGNAEDGDDAPIEETEPLEAMEPMEPEKPSEPTPEDIEAAQIADEERKIQEELNYKKQKDNGLMEELQQRLIKDRTPKRPARPFGPLVPQQRPLILPGGRRWRTPKDAFNEDFIAETLSSQAELIVGHTLGVNFLKYQKPEKKIDLEKSEVYKVVHHLERQPKHGIEMRPAKVLAEEDIRNRVTPISCG